PIAGSGDRDRHRIDGRQHWSESGPGDRSSLRSRAEPLAKVKQSDTHANSVVPQPARRARASGSNSGGTSSCPLAISSASSTWRPVDSSSRSAYSASDAGTIEIGTGPSSSLEGSV